MSKPINVEAQRVQKVISETTDKLKVLSMLNTEFFEGIRKAEQNEIINHFGPQIGKLILQHAWLEDKFGTICIDGVKMIALTDDNVPDEARQTILDLKVTIQKLVRHFLIKENQLKLKAYGQKSVDLEGFIATWQELQKLMDVKLSTPLEEVNQIKENLNQLKAKSGKLQELRDQKNTAYQNYVRECQNSKEYRETQIKTYKQEIGQLKQQLEIEMESIRALGEKDKQREKELHENKVKKQTEEIAKREKALQELKQQNKVEENQKRKEFNTQMYTYNGQMNEYDIQVQQAVHEKEKVNQDYQDQLAEYNTLNDLLNVKRQQNEQRAEVARFMEEKKKQQEEKLDKLVRAAEYIQAHWIGMLTRKDMEKQRKGKKKKGKKKK